MSLNYMIEVKKNQIADFHMVAIVNKHVSFQNFNRLLFGIIEKEKTISSFPHGRIMKSQ